MPNIFSKPMKQTKSVMPETKKQLACLKGAERQDLMTHIYAYDKHSGQPGWVTSELKEFMVDSTPVAPPGWDIRTNGRMGKEAWAETRRAYLVDGKVHKDWTPGLGKKPCGCKREICRHMKPMDLPEDKEEKKKYGSPR